MNSFNLGIIAGAALTVFLSYVLLIAAWQGSWSMFVAGVGTSAGCIMSALCIIFVAAWLWQ